MPAYAHLSLLRTAHESAWFAYWLMEPGADAATRLARGVAAQYNDLDERRKFEEAGRCKSVSPGKLAADRLADLLQEASLRGLIRLNKDGDLVLATAVPSSVDLFDRFEPVPKRIRGQLIYGLY